MGYDKEIKDIICEVMEMESCDMSEITEETNLTDCGLDSMNALMLVVKLEEKYEIILEEEDLFVENLSTINQIKNLIFKYRSKVTSSHDL